MAYSLTGESDVDHLLALAVRDMLASILTADISVPAGPTLADSAADIDNADDGLDVEQDDVAPRVTLKLSDDVQVCGRPDRPPLPAPTHCKHVLEPLYEPRGVRLLHVLRSLQSAPVLTTSSYSCGASILERLVFGRATLWTADFKMTHWIHGLTGSGDKWRCVHRAGCLNLEYLRASGHMDQMADRSAEVVSEQWHLAIWTMAGWTVQHKKCPVKFNESEAYVECSLCKSLLAASRRALLRRCAVSSGLLRRRSPCVPAPGHCTQSFRRRN